MEKNIAIMMADLSGYTALTEVHGAESAADLIQRFLDLVNKSLVGDSRLHERVGDQVVIVSASAENLAYTATFLFDFAHSQKSFLPLHAGLHYGPVVEKNNSIYGSTINIVARLMANADKGKIICSAEFFEQLPPGHSFVTIERGMVQFKNIRKPVQLYEIFCCIDCISRVYVIDPVCHMLIAKPGEALQLEHNGEKHYFCSEKCRKIYMNQYIVTA